MKKRGLSVLLALCMALSLVPVSAQAAGIGETEIKVNETKVAFGGREWWVVGDETHGKQYGCCGATVEVENHVWVGGSCSVCGYLCDHVGGKATCTSGPVCVKCGSEYGQPDPTGHDPAAEWTQENGKHYHACKNGCGTHLDEANCSGGMPTCSKRSECQACGNEFGVRFPNNFCQYRERAATCTEDGQKAHRFCVECQLMLLLDGAETTREGLVIPATGHSWGAPEWTWNEDGTAATVRFTCQNDGTHIQEPAVVMSHKVTTPATCTEAGAAVYTAKVTFEERDYEDSRTVALSALGHDVTHVAAQAPTLHLSGVGAGFLGNNEE